MNRPRPCSYLGHSGAVALLLCGFLGEEVFALPLKLGPASFQARIVRTSSSPRSAKTGQVAVFSAGMNPTQMQVSVVTRTGRPVGREVLWAAPGEALQILFDSSARESVYWVRVGEKGLPVPPKWAPNSGLVLESRKRVNGSANNWAEARKLWQSGREVLGRSVVPNIFSGILPHGPSRDVMIRFHGFFLAPGNGTYEFSTMSDDASFLLVDGRLVAQWPGWHSPYRGRRSRYHGSTRLGRGQHRIEYFNIQNGYGYQVAAAWKPPGQRYFRLMPSSAFLPVARFEVKEVNARSRDAEAAAFAWKNLGHLEAGGRILVLQQFRVVQPRKDFQYHWHFDDGDTETGTEVRHLFLRPGLRKVGIEVFFRNSVIGRIEQPVNIHQQWAQRDPWQKDIYARAKLDVLRRNFAGVPLEDLANLWQVCEKLKERVWMTRVGQACLARVNEFGAEEAEILYQLGFHFQHSSVREYILAESALRGAISEAKEGSVLQEKARLHLGGFLIHSRGEADAGLALLDAIRPEALPSVEKRLRELYRADALLLRGSVNEARRAYVRIGNVVDRGDLHYSARRRARLENARNFLLHKEYDGAEQIVREIEWEVPLERMNSEVGLILVKVYMGRKEYPFARVHSLLLLNAGALDADRAENLYNLVEINLATGNKEASSEILAKLLKEHPYSEAAARAKDRAEFHQLLSSAK